MEPVAGECEDYASQVQADAIIVDALRRRGFAGPDFDRFQDRLIADSTPKLTGAIRSRRAFSDHRSGRYVQPLWRQLRRLQEDPHEARSLANRVVALTLARFRRDALIRCGWDPARGVTVADYFYGAVLQTLPQGYREWLNDQPDLAEIDPADRVHAPPPAPPEPSPRLERQERREELEQILRVLSEQQREVARLLAYGYRNQEIEALLSKPPGSIASIKKRIKKRLISRGHLRGLKEPSSVRVLNGDSEGDPRSILQNRLNQDDDV